jgi:hypothetical protein
MIDLASDLPSFGLTRSDFEAERKRLTSAHGVAYVGDICWGILNRLEYAAKDDAMRTELRFAKAAQLRKEGKDPSAEIKKMYLERIRSFARLGASGVEIMASQCCEECAKLEGKRMTLKAAKKDLPIPNPRCTRLMGSDPFPNCVCTVEVVFPEDG